MNQPYYRTKGKYADGRQKIVVELKLDSGKKVSMSIPKPEDLIKLLGKDLI